MKGAGPNSVLAVNRLRVRGGDGHLLGPFTFSLARGQCHVLKGLARDEMSALFDALTCQRRPVSGSVVFDHRRLDGLAPYRLAALGLTGVAVDPALLRGETVLANLLLARHAERWSVTFEHLFFPPWVRREEINHRRRVEEVLEWLGLQAWRECVVGSLSASLVKWVDLARALVSRPRILILADPAAPLEARECERMAVCLRAAKDRGLALVLMEAEGRLARWLGDDSGPLAPDPDDGEGQACAGRAERQP